MLVELTDGRCRECGGQLEIEDADDATMTVVCLDWNQPWQYTYSRRFWRSKVMLDLGASRDLSTLDRSFFRCGQFGSIAVDAARSTGS